MIRGDPNGGKPLREWGHAHGERAARLGHPGWDLWGKRPLGGWCHTASNKRLCRRLERRVLAKNDLRERLAELMLA